VNDVRKATTMRRIPRAVKLMVAIVALLATTAVGVAAALAGYLPFGGYDRGGYEYSALFGSDLSGYYEQGDYKFSTASFGYVPIGGYERGGYEYSP
jgi:hypothetical protein